LCFSGEGKGRIEHRENKYLFDYKALHEKEKQSWTIALDLPISGQEVLIFNYEKIKASGPFAYRLKKQDRKGLITEVYSLLSQLFKTIDSKSLIKGWQILETKKGQTRLTNNQDFFADFFSKSDGHYRRTILTFKKSSGEPFRLQLFSDSCSLN